jgi:Cdc6-like AAA superfamily ATPase
MSDFMRAKWGLNANLFVSGPPDTNTLSRVFTGREVEIETALAALFEAPRRVLLNGLFGVGKTVLIRELCRRIVLEKKNTIMINEQLYESDGNLAQVILRGLVTSLRGQSETAALYYSGYLGQKVSRTKNFKKKEEIKTGVPNFVKVGVGNELSEEENRSFAEAPSDPIPVIMMLLREAEDAQPDGRVIIAIDDIDKRDPANVRNLLTGSRDLLHSPYCSFVLTSHPLGIFEY